MTNPKDKKNETLKKLKEVDEELEEFIEESETRNEAYTKLVKEFIKRLDPDKT